MNKYVLKEPSNEFEKINRIIMDAINNNNDNCKICGDTDKLVKINDSFHLCEFCFKIQTGKQLHMKDLYT